MRELGQHIRLLPVVTTAAGTSTEGSFDLMADQPFQLEPTFATDDAGLSWNCDRHIVIDTPDAQVLRRFSRERPCVVRLWDSDGHTHDVGTPLIPALAMIAPGLQTATLSIRCEMLSSPLA